MYSKLRFHVQASQGSALGWLGQRLFGALRLPERLAAVPWWARRFSVSLTIFTSDRFADHLNPPGHPERLERAEVMQVVASEFRQRGGDVRAPTPATEEELARVHDREHISLIAETAGRATALDADTFTSPDSY